MAKDEIYANPQFEVADFVFDEAVADVFPDMLQRSVPGYPAIINMIQLLAQRHVQVGSNLYDLGCSLGAATVAMDTGVNVDGCTIVAVDNAPAMIERAERELRLKNAQLKLQCDDIRNVEISQASVVVLNFTLQFLSTEDRLELLKKIRQGLLPGGVLILSEKILGDDQFANELLVDMHHSFKVANGYSELEVAQKRAAIENVLIPETFSQHQERLLEAGFSRVDKWFQCFNFMSLVAQA